MARPDPNICSQKCGNGRAGALRSISMVSFAALWFCAAGKPSIRQTAAPTANADHRNATLPACNKRRSIFQSCERRVVLLRDPPLSELALILRPGHHECGDQPSALDPPRAEAGLIQRSAIDDLIGALLVAPVFIREVEDIGEEVGRI